MYGYSSNSSAQRENKLNAHVLSHLWSMYRRASTLSSDVHSACIQDARQGQGKARQGQGKAREIEGRRVSLDSYSNL